jgi:capsule synthesis protein PGA_cap
VAGPLRRYNARVRLPCKERVFGGHRRSLTRATAALAAGALVAGTVAARGGDADAGVRAGKPRPAPPLSLIWGGDVTLGSSYGMPPDHARGMLAAVAPTMRAADVAAVNLEGTLGAGGASKCPPPPRAATNCFAFQAPAANAGALRVAGVDMVNLANNHAFDFGAAGMGQTLLALRAHRVAWTGRPGEIRHLQVAGARLAFLGFSAYSWSSPIRDGAAVRRLVGAAARDADIVVVFMHAGAEGAGQTHTPDREEQAFGELRGNPRAFGHTAVDAGADLVLGSGPHVMRGIEVYRRRVIAYSLGNLAGYGNFAAGGPLSISGLLRVQVASDGALAGGRLVALRLVGAGLPVRDPTRAAVKLVARVSRADFGRRAVRLSPSGRIVVAAATTPMPVS